jgi:hypothetical protein
VWYAISNEDTPTTVGDIPVYTTMALLGPISFVTFLLWLIEQHEDKPIYTPKKKDPK